MAVNNQSMKANFLCLGLQLPTSKLILEVLESLGISFRKSLHDGYEEHQVVEITHGYLEFFPKEKGDVYTMLAFESDDIESCLRALPNSFELVEKRETDLDNYSMVAICKYRYNQDFQVKIYEKAVK